MFVAAGRAGSGRTRFLAEVRKAARLQGYGVLTLVGKPALKDRVFGALTEACQEWEGLPFPLMGEPRLLDAIQTALDEKAEIGLLVTLDNIEAIDHDSLDFLRGLFISSSFSRIALVYATGDEHQSLIQEAHLRLSVELEPITESGVRVWIRQSLQWEAPDEFVAWLHVQTGGLPANIQKGLACLVEQGVIKQLGSAWSIRPDYDAFPLSSEITRPAALPPPNLPVYHTEFVGREAELRAIKKLIHEERLVLIVGSPGVGKTRLASQAVAESISTFPNGVCFISLTSLNSVDILIYTIADALHLSLAGPQDPKTQLFNYFSTARRETLLVLDGFDQLSGGASLLAELLERAPAVRVLVTSTQHLGLPSAVTFELHGLLFPEAEAGEDIQDYVAMQLFVRVARRTNPSFVLSKEDSPYAARICRLVGGIPLLIELAAAWARALSCQEIAAGIERNLSFLTTDRPDVPERHRSLLAVFDALWGLLSRGEQKAMRQLSVFRGGFSEDAARTIADASPFFLDGLVAKAYLRRSPGGRFVLHELLRQYVSARLRDLPREQASTSDQHCIYYTTFVHDRKSLLRGRRQVILEMSAEIENIRTAWDWAVVNARLAEIDRSLDGLSRFYDLIGWYQEAETAFGVAASRLQSLLGDLRWPQRRVRSLLGRLLAAQASFLNRRAMYNRAAEVSRALLGLIQPDQQDGFEAAGYLQFGRALRGQGNLELCRQNLARALDLAKKKRLSAVATDSLTELGEIYLSLGLHNEATLYYEQALQIYRKAADRRGEGQAQNFLGLVCKNKGEFAQARLYLEQAFNIFREIGDRRGEGQALNNLGLVSTNLGEYHVARIYYEQALPIYREIGDRQGESWGLNSIGYVYYRQGEYDAARAYFDQALSLSGETGDRWGESVSYYNLGDVFMTLGDYARAEDCLQRALNLCNELGDRWGVAWRLADLGLYYHQCGNNENALDYNRLALQIAREVGDRPLQGKILTYLGHILAGLGSLHEAAETYGQAIKVRQDISGETMIMDPLAGLAHVELEAGQLVQARSRIAEILAYLEEGNVDGAEDPFRVYWSCYRVLEAGEDPRAWGILNAAYHLLQEQASKIMDDSLRASFLSGVSDHRELIHAWNNHPQRPGP
ncbi:MAG: tetratricopeptide repeat protein [Chloroflexota bacterium]|nr:MAG: tetratricopeptide repeat protein [Chloroflexota bacterium]